MASESGNPIDHVVQHPMVQRDANLGPLSPGGKITLFSDHISMILLAGALLVVTLPMALRRKRSNNDAVERHVPRGFANVIEVICEYLRKNVVEPQLGKHTDRFIKYLWSLFFFVLAMNLLGMLPIPAISALFGHHLGGTPTANAWVTGTLAIITLLMMVWNGLRLGGLDYIKHFNPGPWWMAPLLVPIEILGLFAKCFALAVRLFANMIAGHLVLTVLLGFILAAGAKSALMGGVIAVPVVLASVALTCLEIFVAFLQAFIFTFLTTVFIGMSVNVHHDEHHDDHAADAHGGSTPGVGTAAAH